MQIRKGKEKDNIALPRLAMLALYNLGGAVVAALVLTFVTFASSPVVAVLLFVVVGAGQGGLAWASVHYGKVYRPVVAAAIVGSIGALLIGLQVLAMGLEYDSTWTRRQLTHVVGAVIGAVTATAVAYETARHLFCTHTDDWFEWQLLGYTTASDLTALLEALQAAEVNVDRVNALLHPEFEIQRRVRVEVGRCAPDEDGVLRAQIYVSPGTGTRRTVVVGDGYLRRDVVVPAAMMDALGA